MPRKPTGTTKVKPKPGTPSTVIFINDDENEKDAEKYGCQYQPLNLKKKEKGPLSFRTSGLNYSYTFFSYLCSEDSVVFRVASSLIPPFGRFSRVAVDWEGCFLSVFLLWVTLYWGLVRKGEEKEEGSWPRLAAFGKAGAVIAAYQVGASVVTFLLAKAAKTWIKFRQVVCILGYGLFGHALTLLVCEALGGSAYFMGVLSLIGGLDCVRVSLILMWRTPNPGWRFVICTPVAVVHLLFLVYLHFKIMK